MEEEGKVIKIQIAVTIRCHGNKNKYKFLASFDSPREHILKRTKKEKKIKRKPESCKDKNRDLCRGAHGLQGRFEVISCHHSDITEGNGSI